MNTAAQVNVGTIVSNAMDGAFKKIFQDLANAAAGGTPIHQAPAFSGLNASVADKLASVPAAELQEFLSCYSGINYKMGFLPGAPSLTVTQVKDTAQIVAAGAGVDPHILGGSITIGGSWSF